MPQTLSLNEDTPVSISLQGTDPDGDSITYLITAQPAYGTLAGSGNTFTYTPIADFYGDDSFQFKVNDGELDSEPATVTLQIQSVNDAPVADEQALMIDEDSAVTIILSGGDVDGDELTFAISTQPTSGTLSPIAIVDGVAQVVYTPDPDVNGLDSFEYITHDGELSSLSAVVEISILPVNEAPVAVTDFIEIKEGESLFIYPLENDYDIEGSSLTLVDFSGNTLGSIEANLLEGSMIYTPYGTNEGTDYIEYIVSDGTAQSNGLIRIDVGNLSAPPVFDLGENTRIDIDAFVQFEGVIIACNDDWVFSTLGYSQASTTGRFLENILATFSKGEPSKFLILSTAGQFTSTEFYDRILSLGHEYLVDGSGHQYTLEELEEFAGIFTLGQNQDPDVLAEYLEGGGNLYIGAGQGSAGQANLFLSSYGIEYDADTFNSYIGAVPIDNDHPLFEGVESLFYYNGNNLSVSSESSGTPQIIHQDNSQGLIAVHGFGLAQVQLLVDIDLDNAEGTILWEQVSGPGVVTFDDPTISNPILRISRTGDYLIKVTYADGEYFLTDTVWVTVSNNRSPLVNAGEDIVLGATETSTNLEGSVSDDGLPFDSEIIYDWNVINHPFSNEIGQNSPLIFTQKDSLETEIQIDSVSGLYMVELTADDGEFIGKDVLEIRYNMPTEIPDSENLSAFWPFNQSLRDRVSHLEIQSSRDSAKYGNGIIGSSLSFDGVDDQFFIDSESVSDLGGLDSFTVEFFVRPKIPFDNKTRNLLDWENGPIQGLLLNTYNTRLDFRIAHQEGTSNVFIDNVLANDEWTHIAFSYNRESGMFRIYVDGKIERQIHLGDVRLLTQGYLFLGKGTSNVGLSLHPYWGSLDELAIHHDELSPQVISKIAQSSRGRYVGEDNAPFVDAGYPIYSEQLDGIELLGVAMDDGFPLSDLTISWKVLAYPEDVLSPDEVLFSDASSLTPIVDFPAPGKYTLQLSVDDGARMASDTVLVDIQGDCSIMDDPNLLGWLPFEWDSKNIAQPEATVQVFNGETYSTGVIGSSFTFADERALQIRNDGSLDADGYDGFSFAMWINPQGGNSTSVRNILQWHDGVRDGIIFSHYGTRLDARLYREGGSPIGILAYNFLTFDLWQHLAVTYDKNLGEIRFYLNGNLFQVSSVPVGTDLITEGDLWLGKTPRLGYGNPYYGRMDEWMLFSKKLSPEEILELATSSYCPPNVSVNQPPVVKTPPSRNITEAVFPLEIALNAQVFDDGLPEGNPIEIQWTQLSEPSVLDLVNPNLANASAIVGESGEYLFQVEVTDGELSQVTETKIIVTAIDPFIDVELSSNLSVNCFEPFQIDPIVSFSPSIDGGSANYLWQLVYGVGSKLFVTDSHSKNPEFEISQPGEYRLSLSVSQGETLTQKEVTLSAVSKPVVTIGTPLNGAFVSDIEPLTVGVDAFDYFNEVIRVELLLDGTSLGFAIADPSDGVVGGNGLWKFEIPKQFLNQGSAEIKAIATSNHGIISETAIEVEIVSDSGNFPSVEIISPSDSNRITHPVSLVGSIYSENLDRYVVETRSKNQEVWNLINEGEANVVESELAIIDPTLSRNGVLDVRITAWDAFGRSTSQTINLIVSTGMKIGHFAMAFEDLSISAGGVPLQVIRSYDSRDTNNGDFGLGWNLTFNSIRLEKSAPLGEGWSQEQKLVEVPGVGETLAYSLEPVRRKIVFISFPDDTVYAFEAKTDPQYQQFSPIRFPDMIFEPIFGTVGSLEPVADTGIEVSPLNGSVQLLKDDFSFELYNPTEFILTTQAGTRFLLDETDGLIWMEDRLGNKLEILDDKIKSTSKDPNGGPDVIREVLFARDIEGRITQITDPEGNVLTYHYNSEGHLIEFRDREQNEPASPLYGEFTEFRYENPTFPHYLTSIIDPRGVQAIRSEYDEDGRLIRQIDADGNPVEMDHDIANFTETITDRLGNPTVYEYNAYGDVVAQTTVDPNDPEGPGLRTEFVVDTNGNVLMETDPLGNVTEMTYDDQDNLLTETQYVSDGNGGQIALTTAYTYDHYCPK